MAFALLLATGLLFFQSCKFYYKVTAVSPVSPQEMTSYNAAGKYFVLHKGEVAYQLSGLIIAGDTLHGSLADLPENRYKYKTTRINKANRYRNNPNKDETYVLNEVHLYLPDSASRDLSAGSHFRLAIPEIGRAEEYLPAKSKTRASWIVPPASVIGLLVLMEVVEALTTTETKK